MGNGKLVLEMADEIYSIVAQPLSDHYDLEIRKPETDLMSRRLEDLKEEDELPAGKFITRGKDGLVLLHDRICKKKSICSGVYSHELGHAVTWQNYKLNVPKDKIYVILAEGIAMDFENKGLEVLVQNGYLNPVEGMARRIYKEWDYSWVRKYFMGRNIVRHLKTEGVEVKDIILNPERFAEEIKNKLRNPFYKIKFNLPISALV